MVSVIGKKYTIGVVVPVYNVSHYLRECLDSIFQQTIPFDEVIIIEDGSTDDSLLICREYERKYPAITLISQFNQGLSVSRNKGIDNARCDYIIFLDSDDLISTYMVESMHKYLVGQDVLLYSSDIKNELCVGNRTNLYVRPNHVCYIPMDGVQYLDAMFPQYYIVSSCMGAYKQSFLRDNHIRFLEGVYYEDHSLFVQVVSKAKYIECIPDKLYIRRYRENSITSSQVTEKHCKDICIVQRMIWQYLSKEDLKRWNVNLLLYFLLSELQEARVITDQMNSLFSVYEKKLILHEFVLYWGKLMRRKDLSLSVYAKTLQICDEIKDLYPKEYRRLYNNTYSNMIISLKRKLDEIPFNNPRKKIGVYGKGNHTNALFSLYEKLLEPIQSKIIYIETNHNDSNGLSISSNTLSYRNIPNDLDALVISSFIYQNDMLRNINEVSYNEKKIIILYKKYEFIDMVEINKILCLKSERRNS